MAGAAELTNWLRAEWGSLTRLNRSDRRWPMPFAAALASGLPLLVGAWFGHLDYGLISSLGGMVFLYLPETPMYHRMVVLLACAFALIASLIAFLYSLIMLRRQAPRPIPPLPAPTFDFVAFDAVIVGLFVGIAPTLAHALQLAQPYWVPISCLAVLQGMTLRAVWTKQIHRIVGTAIGLLLVWGVLPTGLTSTPSSS